MLCESRSSPRTLWPSGLRRWLKAPFRKGVGSNPTGVILKIVICGLQLDAIACFSDGSIGVSQLRLQRHSFAFASLQTSASTGHGMKSMISLGVWRNGSASDSRSEGWEFESLCPHFLLGGFERVSMCVLAWPLRRKLEEQFSRRSHKRAHPDLNQGPADLQSAALTTELCTHARCGRY